MHRSLHGEVRRSPQIGEVAILHEERRPKGLWKVARMKELNQSADGKIRSAKVALANQQTLT